MGEDCVENPFIPLMSENLGFLTVIEQLPNGLTGGYLVLNRSGRPLEFHCTTPLFPEKIQQILYGNTFQPFLYGEKIANTLLQRSKLPVLSVLTNSPFVLTVQPLVSVPVIYVFEDSRKQIGDAGSGVSPIREIPEELNESLKTFGIDNANLRTASAHSDEMPQVPNVPGFGTETWREVRIGNRLIAAPKTDEPAWEQLVAEIRERARTIELLEPFARIRLALEEAKNAA